MVSKILTTHVGSLPRSKQLSEYLFAKDKGKKIDNQKFENILISNVDQIVKRQLEVGIDFISDGEMSKISYATYICLLYTSPSPRDGLLSRMPSSA